MSCTSVILVSSFLSETIHASNKDQWWISINSMTSFIDVKFVIEKTVDENITLYKCVEKSSSEQKMAHTFFWP